MYFHHIVIFYRVPGFPDVLYTVAYANALKKLVFYDVDDLIFDGEMIESKFRGKQESISHKELRDLVSGAELFRKAMALCTFGIASTPSLATEMEKHLQSGRCYVLRNALDEVTENFRKFPPEKIDRPNLSIFYGSGTRTHDSDLNSVARSLARVFKEISSVRLTLVGSVSLPGILGPFSDRIDRFGLLSIEAYLEVLAHADINIAPLEPCRFADAKSEIKWLEAAVFGIPSVVTRTKTYDEILIDGQDAMLADTENEWFEKLDRLLKDDKLRKTIGDSAREKAQSRYSTEVMSQELQKIINNAAQRDPMVTFLPSNHRKKKIHLVFVNVLFAPQGFGGATVMVESIVDELSEKYGECYEISIFTGNYQDLRPYELFSYTHKNATVTSIGIPVSPEMDRKYKDETVKNIFRRYLVFNNPAIVHFHCLQRLTASPLEAALELNIPSIVTLHDSWWISDYQFLLDRDNRVCDLQQNDPVIAAKTSTDPNDTLVRRRYLSQILQQSDMRLAVSSFLADLYQRNGVMDVLVSKNGVQLDRVIKKKEREKGKIRMGYLGGVSAHKGYFLLKKAVTRADLANTELVVVDASGDYRRRRRKTAKWGTARISFSSKIEKERMPEFFSSIDVLIAPSISPESFGLVTREAQLAGVWVVASDAGALAEDLENGVDGYVFSAGNCDELVAVLKRIDKNPGHYKIMPAGSPPIRTVSDQVKELNEIYHRMFSQKQTKSCRSR